MSWGRAPPPSAFLLASLAAALRPRSSLVRPEDGGDVAMLVQDVQDLDGILALPVEDDVGEAVKRAAA